MLFTIYTNCSSLRLPFPFDVSVLFVCYHLLKEHVHYRAQLWAPRYTGR